MGIKKVINLFTFMESSIKNDFLVVEHFLKDCGLVNDHNELKIDQEIFTKIVLCPLIMDFGVKNIRNVRTFYNIPPSKPIVDQMDDLFRAIHFYYTHEIEIAVDKEPVKFQLKSTTLDKSERLFEILPFMGLNTQNYSMNEIEEMLEKYFGDFLSGDTKEQRQGRLISAMGRYPIDFDDIRRCRNIFAGIKLYPPLGFDPWPEDRDEELEKVKVLYDKCIEKNIPLTTHCSTGGFKAVKKHRAYTNPAAKWAKVLSQPEYGALKLNFAHFGEGNLKWQKTIINHLSEKGSRGFTDFSCNLGSNHYYKKLKRRITNTAGVDLNRRILFGSDFMINLLWYNSYNEFLECFLNSTHLTHLQKCAMANENSERFLFE